MSGRGGWNNDEMDRRDGDARGFRSRRDYDDRYNDYPPAAPPPRYMDRRPPRDYPRSGGRGGPPPPRRKVPPHALVFHSYEEERDWVERRRRQRMSRRSRFDVTPEQLGLSEGLPRSSLIDPSLMTAALGDTGPQQTRHARRLYVGNLPLGVTEAQIHAAFRNAIIQTLQPGSGVPDPAVEDPILSVYINPERRFSFVEFKSVELCSACMGLDGLEVVPGQPTVKIKRPNDYVPSMAPLENFKPQLDLSKIGIISSAVLDGPNKIFIGGLHYHLQDHQVLELLQAFGPVKAFHLVKNEPESSLSKGYCFVEYVDPGLTPIAVAGLNGMDIGGGKSLTARLAGERTGAFLMATPEVATTTMADASSEARTIVAGYDVEALVDAAMGKGPMPQAPTHFDSFGQPLTRIVPLLPAPGFLYPTAATAALPTPLTMANSLPLPPLPTAVEPPPPVEPPTETRILVLLNMVTEEDLATDEDYHGLLEEVREECRKFGELLEVRIPRAASATIAPGAVGKVYLSYAAPSDAARAQQELAGRQFGAQVVETSFYAEADFAAGRLQ
jgi:splicing factor U2AF 65 kDa subunit